MDSQAANRINAAVEALFHQLPSYKPGTWALTRHPSEKRIAFSVYHKAPDGKRTQYNPIPTHALRVIEQTSETVDEICRRIRLYVIEGKDTTQTAKPAQGMSAEEIEKIVQERLNEALKKFMLPEATKQGLQPAKYVRDPAREAAAKAERSAEYEMWMSRAQQLGIAQPQLTTAGRIDKRWIASAEKAWKKFTEGEGAALVSPEPTV